MINAPDFIADTSLGHTTAYTTEEEHVARVDAMIAKERAEDLVHQAKFKADVEKGIVR